MTTASPEISETSRSSPLRVVTWNIEHGREVEAAAAAITAHDHLRGADVFLFQELDEEGTATLADALGCSYVYAPASIHSKTGRQFGNAIVSPWSMGAAGVVELPHIARVRGEQRIALTTVVEVGDTPVAVYCTHTEIPLLGRAKRRSQIAHVGVSASTAVPSRVVVGGDFNSATRRAVDDLVQGFSGRGFAHASAVAGRTLRRAGRDFTLDHVFARGMETMDAGVVRDVPVSDHDPVWVRLELG